MELIGVAILRKVVFILLLLITYLVIDRGLLNGFDTPKVLADDPKAIGVLLGLLAVAVALA
jgi:hypothetical protein